MDIESKGGTDPTNFVAPVELQRDAQLVRVEKDKVSVLGVEIPRNPEPGLRTPSPEKFKDFQEDESSIPDLQIIAKSVVLDEPLLLEAKAARGKSSSIEYLASLSNQEVYRMSLNGQTDTTDLIGKWVPKTEGLSDELWKCIKSGQVSEATAKILETKKLVDLGGQEIEKGNELTGRDGLLTKEDLQQIALNEGIEVEESEWAWQDGELPRQIQDGAWTVLDEVNTCEPQILVRLNSILEKGGELILHEDGGRIPKPKDPNKLHRLFATVNPPGGRYRGRVPLSAEWISRWNYQQLGELSEEMEIKREQRILGCEIPLDTTQLKEKMVNPVGVGTEKKFSEVFSPEWTADFVSKYVSAFRKVQEMLEKEEVGRDQEQKFDLDQRDRIRFRDYISIFYEPGNMGKVIRDAVEYCVLGKFKAKADRTKAEDVIFQLVKVQEPKVEELDSSKEQSQALNNLKVNIISSGVPESHKELIME